MTQGRGIKKQWEMDLETRYTDAEVVVAMAGIITLATPATDGGIVKAGAGVLTLSAAGAYTATVPATGTVALLEAANSFTLINPLTTPAESWIGPSATTGIYFKGGNIGLHTVNPLFDVHISKVDAASIVIMDSYGDTAPSNNQIIGRVAGGTESSPTDTPANRLLLAFAGRGYYGGTFTTSRAFFAAKSEEAFTASAQGTAMVFETTPIGSITRAETMRLTGAGYLGIGNITPASRLDIANGAFTMAEMTAPSAPAANGVVIYAEDDGGKTKVMALFATGVAQQICIQP